MTFKTLNQPQYSWFALAILSLMFQGTSASSAVLSPTDESTFKKIQVAVTIPDLIEVVKEIGGDRVDVFSLTDGRSDPHHFEAKGSFISKLLRADAVCSLGLELEESWLPRVLSRTGKTQIQKGGDGFCELGTAIKALEVPSGTLDRSYGHVHASGNPHFQLDLKSLAEGSRVVLETLVKIDPSSEQKFRINQVNFVKRMNLLHAEIYHILEPIRLVKNPVVIEYHKDFTYFFNTYGIRSQGMIEEKPGLLPSAHRLVKVSEEAKEILFVLAAPYSPERILKKFGALSNKPVVRAPTMVDPQDPRLNTIEKVQRHLAQIFLDQIKVNQSKKTLSMSPSDSP